MEADDYTIMPLKKYFMDILTGTYIDYNGISVEKNNL